MIHLDGPLNFKSFSRLIHSETFALMNSLGASLNFSHENMDYALAPLGSDGAKSANILGGISYIKYVLLSGDFVRLGFFTVFQSDKDSYIIISDIDISLDSSDHFSRALICITEFLEDEFDATDIYLFSGSEELVDKITDTQVFLDLIKEVKMRKLPRKIDDFIPDLILTAGPSISALENSYVQEATRNGWNTSHSDYITYFEKYFADFVGVKYAMATSSCTGALHLALLALGIGPGDEVLVPDITWVATASAVRYVGAKPIFVDIDKDSWTIDPTEISKLVTRNTKAIIPVHLYGYGAAMPEILNIAASHGLYVVEDAAPAIGTQISDRFAGSFGDFGCYSFQGAKLLVTGEGGMLVSNNQELMARARKIQDHGRRPGTFWIEELGYKYKMNNITAALGLAQIQRVQNQIVRKRQINEWYREGLEGIPSISFQQEAVDTQSICWMTSFVLDENSKVSRDDLIVQLKKFGVDSRPVFPSISQYPIWGYEPGIPSNSKFIGDRGINLPSGVLLNKSSIEKVIETIRTILD